MQKFTRATSDLISCEKSYVHIKVRFFEIGDQISQDDICYVALKN